MATRMRRLMRIWLEVGFGCVLVACMRVITWPMRAIMWLMQYGKAVWQ
jgi:hypothetical protein